MTNPLSWCSWCYADDVDFQLLSKSWLGRDTYACPACTHQVSICLNFQCSNGARSYPDGADKLCFWCSGLPIEDVKENDREGRCSHCTAYGTHTLYRACLMQRNEYICSQCQLPTLPCRNCTNFARNNSTWADELCLVCDPLVPEATDWKDLDKALSIPSKWCSWCFKEGSHSFRMSRALRRRLYSCDSCTQSTLVCSSCDQGMTRSTALWDEKLCAICTSPDDSSWLAMAARRDALVAPEWTLDEIQAELSRESPFRDTARTKLVERPFLLLVTCSGEDLLDICYSLEIPILDLDLGTDRHAIASEILFNPKGIVSRVAGVTEKNDIIPWSTVLDRVYLSAFNDSSILEIDAVLDKEERFLTKLLGKSKPSESAETSNKLAEKMKVAGFRDKHVIDYGSQVGTKVLIGGKYHMAMHGLQAVAAHSPLLPVLGFFALPVFIASIGYLSYKGVQLAFGSTEGHVFIPITAVLMQRMKCSFEDIVIAT